MFLILAILYFSLHYFYPQKPKTIKLYWFIPDGMRADPELFNIYKWAEEGKLPNIKKLMENGAYGFSIPDFPSHTPTNFASLLTGSHPSVHGIADGPMHVEGYPLEKPSVKGFSSTAKKVPPAWVIFENIGKKVVLLSVPGSTPPELKKGITIRGRWGGWGADVHALIFEPENRLNIRKQLGRAIRLFFLGPELTRYVKVYPAENWSNVPETFSPAIEAELEGYGSKIYIYISDSTDDNKVNYDRVTFALNKSSPLVTLKQGEWSEWLPIKLKWKEVSYDSYFKVKVIKLWENGDFRIRVFYNNLNEYIAQPSYVAKEIIENVGPMTDFADNWPPQLIYEPEDKQTFLEEANMTFNWHRKAADFIIKTYSPDVFIQDIYTPNQMLESRWWHGYIDKNSRVYSPEKESEAWNDLLWMYKKLDAIIGEMLKNADENTIIVLSSDHGVCPLHRIVKLNNLFAKKGWLKFKIDENTGEPIIDWNNTKVIYLKMAHIYVNPNGLGGKWKRASGPEYEKLREEVINTLYSIEDENGIKPVLKAVKWEDAPKVFNLPTDRIGDIVIEANPGYFWSEEVDENLTIFANPLTTGYKQTINATENKCMWTPFIIAGPGVKKNYRIEKPISHIDQLPTILYLMGIDIPNYMQGKVLNEIVEK